MEKETVNQETATKEVETKTFTQEEVNGIVNDRLARERKKYEGIDLEALKSKAANALSINTRSPTDTAFSCSPKAGWSTSAAPPDTPASS